MDNIINSFPTAAEIKDGNKDKYKEYLFEKEITSIFRLIIWAINNEINTVKLMDLSDEAFHFLVDKGYMVKKMEPQYYSISWE